MSRQFTPKHKTLVAISLGLAVLSSGCKFTVSNNLVKKHPDDVEAFAEKARDAFYTHDTDFIIDNAQAGISGFTQPNIAAIQELISDSSEQERSIVGQRGTQTENTTKYYVSIFYTPRSVGREDLKVTLTKPDDKCCKIAGMNLQVRIGENFVMATKEDKIESSSETNED